jgi:hypothetical protein
VATAADRDGHERAGTRGPENAGCRWPVERPPVERPPFQGRFGHLGLADVALGHLWLARAWRGHGGIHSGFVVWPVHGSSFGVGLVEIWFRLEGLRGVLDGCRAGR